VTAIPSSAPAVSVVIPNYNHARYLRQRIDSVLEQTYPELEVIVLDDASTDESRPLIAGYAKDARVRVVFNERNSGNTFRQWNKGVHLARGEYIWIAESDDYADSRFLERLTPILNGDAEIAFVYCRSKRVLGEGETNQFADPEVSELTRLRWTTDYIADGLAECSHYLVQRNTIPNVSAVLFRKASYEHAGGADETLKLCGDWKLWASMAMTGKIAYVAEPLNYYRYHEATVRARSKRAGLSDKEGAKVARWVQRMTLRARQKKAKRDGSPANTEISESRGRIEKKNAAPIRAIAFHLPQFHPIPENDEWWGKGFTEWTNVVKAKPRFKGHYQPHLPSDLGFYDLRLPETRLAQAELAARYGVHGFCYYHYWFHGRRLLERPEIEIWKSGEPKFPFCLCWANENWTRRWDGLQNETLIEQRYSAEDDLQHIHGLIPIFEDARYIRVNRCPLFLVYKASGLPEPQRTTELWRREAQHAGLPGLFLVRVESHTDLWGDPRDLGFDAAVEFQPRGALAHERVFRRKWWHIRRIGTHEQGLRENYVLEYEELARKAVAAPRVLYPRIPGVCPGWDNSPRLKQNALIFENSTPGIYCWWLKEIVSRQRAVGVQQQDSFESLVFINAWNEWAEGNHLEPCQRWGRKYLDATRAALET
jgi:glycosyltransferase involved in cell wall biosynthesis